MLKSAATKLLTSLDPLDYSARMRRLADETRRLSTEGGLGAVLDELSAGDAYQRELALIMAAIAADLDRVVRALADPLYRIRCKALAICVHHPEADDAVAATLADAPLAWRIFLIGSVRSTGREQFADRVFQMLLDQGDEVGAARLLPACSEPVVARMVPELDHKAGEWSRLGRRHPDLVIDHARRELSGLAEGARDSWWDACGPGVAAAAELRPLRVLDLLEQVPVGSGMPHVLISHIRPLVRADEARVLRLLTAPDGRMVARWHSLSRGTCKRLTVTGLPEIELIAHALRDNPYQLSRLLHDLPPGRRAEFYDKVTADKDTSREIVTPTVLDVLPHERRHAEARRMLDLSAVAEDTGLRLTIVARLPWAEARDRLRTAVRSADADERARAYRLLISCAAAGHDPAEVTALLTEELGRLRNDQDPVRSAALGALATLPAELFEDTDPVTAALTGLLVDATEARDASWTTRDALRALACRIMSGPAAVAGGGSATNAGSAAGTGGELLAWSLTVFQELAATNGGQSLGRLDQTLRRGQETAVHQAIEPWIARGLARGDSRLTLTFATSLGRRAWPIAGLQSALEHVVRNATAGPSTQAIELWLADPSTRAERTGRLLAWEPTAAALYRVSWTLSEQRTDLLDPYLREGLPTEGRFVTRGVSWFPSLIPSHRWLPRQVDAYARLKAKVAADPGAQMHVRADAVRVLGGLPGHGQAEVRRYLDSPDVALAEAALGALAWGEDPAADLPLLLSHADGHRARVAVYAATRAARYARPGEAAAVLRPVALSPTSKVTSRKEAVRIAAELRIPDLVGFLSEVWHTERQHRDVKAAVVSRLAANLDDPRVQPMLRAALTAEPEIAVPLLTVQPLGLPVRHRADFGGLIADLCVNEDPKIARAALVQAPRWYPWSESAAAAVCAAMTDLTRWTVLGSSPTELYALLGNGLPIDQLVDILSTLLDADDADTTEIASAQHDRPARRRLVWTVNGAVAYGQYRAAERRPTLLAAAETLTGRADYLNQAVELRATIVALDGGADAVTADLLDLADRAAGRHDAAERAGNVLAGAIRRKQPWDPAAALAAAESLAARPDQAAGLIGVRMLSAVGPALGWPEAYRHVVSTLRRHPDPAVVAAALDLNTGSD